MLNHINLVQSAVTQGKNRDALAILWGRTNILCRHRQGEAWAAGNTCPNLVCRNTKIWCQAPPRRVKIGHMSQLENQLCTHASARKLEHMQASCDKVCMFLYQKQFTKDMNRIIR